MVETTDTNSGARVGAESQFEHENSESLVGRSVIFRWERYHAKPMELKGTVLQAGRIPGTVIIESVGVRVKPLRNGRIKATHWDGHPPTRALHCRPVSEIEVLA